MSLSEQDYLARLKGDRQAAIAELLAAIVEEWTHEGGDAVARNLAAWATRGSGRLPRLELGDDVSMLALARESGLIHDQKDPIYRVSREDYEVEGSMLLACGLTFKRARALAYRRALLLRDQHTAADRAAITITERVTDPDDDRAGYSVYREGELVAEFRIEPAPGPIAPPDAQRVED
jgi:hypothetical protein